MEYLVTWRVELDAANPEEAARLAQQMQRDASSLATVFEVLAEGEENPTFVGLTWNGSIL